MGHKPLYPPWQLVVTLELGKILDYIFLFQGLKLAKNLLFSQENMDNYTR